MNRWRRLVAWVRAAVAPADFKFPQSYLQLLSSGNLPDLTPWEFLYLDESRALRYYRDMLGRYLDKRLIPFAIIDDQTGLYNDGYVVLACFDGDDRSGNPRIYFHDYEHLGRADWSERDAVPHFDAWLQLATEESQRYKAMRDEE